MATRMFTLRLGFPELPDTEMVGYAAVAGTDGGTGGDVYSVSTYAQFKDAVVNQSGARIVNLTGSTNFNGGGDSLNVDNGDLTIDGSSYTGVIYNTKWVFRCSNVIIKEVAWRTGEGSSAGASDDRRSLTFNPGTDPGEMLEKVAVIKCSLGFGPDVIGSFINDCRDITVQDCIIGPALEESNIASSPNGYGMNVTVPGNGDPDVRYGHRMTFYRNFYVLNKQRNLKFEHVDGVDAVNNVIYDYGNQCPVKGNFRGGNIVSNIFKKGPQTQASNEAFEEDTNYAQYADSTYWDDNIGITAVGGSFTPAWNDVDGAADRATPYDGGPTDADHGPLTVDTADAALFADVVANAGRTYEDSIDALMRTYATAGTDGGDFYKGSGLGSPSQPVPPI